MANPRKKKTTVTAPDGSKAVSKTDRKGRVKKITYTDEVGNKNGVEYIPKIERQRQEQYRSNPEYRDEDSMPNAKMGGTIFEEAVKSNNKRKRAPRGY